MKPDKLFETLELIPNHRSAAFDSLEVSPWSQGFRFEGHAAVFDEEADIGPFTESVERGAFRKVLSQSENVPMLYEHNNGLPLLASTRSGTLKLEEDVKGLSVVADVADTTLGRDLQVLASRGDVYAMSYGFVAGKGNSRVEMRSTKPHRTLIGFRSLLDVSPTWDPVFATADGQFRSLAMQYADDSESLQQLHMGAYPQRVWQGIDVSDSEESETNDEPEQRSAGAAGEEEENVESGAATPEQIRARAAARKRRLSVLAITLKE